ncbi:MAG: transcriptional repressor LexA [Prosthecobacter sp.]|uniref:transcriptional repressor LexA n=1 Tax=Prosthecobacter sp. TaxID=1965333 RepID=UPI003BAF4B80
MRDKNAMTKRQEEVLGFIEDFVKERSFAPILQEICDHFGFKSPNAASDHLKALAKKGYVAWSPNSPRSIQLLVRRAGRPGRTDMVTVPLLGRIAAGHPIFALENVEDHLELPRQLFRGRKLFALKVQGDSMTGAGIFEGDLAILAAQPDFENGQIAAVVVDEEATLKRLYRTSRGLRLKAENPAFPDRVVSSEAARSCRLAGILVGTIRRF